MIKKKFELPKISGAFGAYIYLLAIIQFAMAVSPDELSAHARKEVLWMFGIGITWLLYVVLRPWLNAVINKIFLSKGESI